MECCLKTYLSKGSRNKTKVKTRKDRSKGQRRITEFKEITELISADTLQPIIAEVNVEGVVSLTQNQIRYLKERAKMGKFLRKHFLPWKSTFQVFWKKMGNFPSQKTIEVKVLEVKVNLI